MRPPHTNISCCVVALLVLTGCTTDTRPDTSGPDRSGEQLSQSSVGPDASHRVVVDCLLPGQLRSLGTSRSFLTPRRPVRITVSECEIRGGEIAVKGRRPTTRIDDERAYGGMF